MTDFRDDLRSKFNGARLTKSPLDSIINKNLNNVDDPVVVSVGINSGKNVRTLANAFKSNVVYAVDDFEGLEEDWIANFPAGSLVRTEPSLPNNVHVIRDKSADGCRILQLDNINDQKIDLLIIDCYCYTPTKQALTILADNIRTGTILLFTQFFNYDGYENHGVKAFEEFLDETNKQYQVLGMYGSPYARRRNSYNKMGAIYVYNADEEAEEVNDGVTSGAVSASGTLSGAGSSSYSSSSSSSSNKSRRSKKASKKKKKQLKKSMKEREKRKLKNMTKRQRKAYKRDKKDKDKERKKSLKTAHKASKKSKKIDKKLDKHKRKESRTRDKRERKHSKKEAKASRKLSRRMSTSMSRTRSMSEINVITQNDGETRIKLVIPWGRKDRVECLLNYVIASLDLFDEVLIWQNTDDVEAMELSEQLLANQPDKFTIMQNCGTGGLEGVRPMYNELREPNTLYIKCDDDIVYAHDDAFENLINFAKNHRDEYCMFSGNVINNGVLDVEHQEAGISSADIVINSSKPHKVLCTIDGALQVHGSFVDAYNNENGKSVDDYSSMSNHVYLSNQSWAPNVIAFFGDLFGSSDILKIMDKGDKYICNKLPERKEKRVIAVGSAVFVHYSFQKQEKREFDDERVILNMYREIAGVDDYPIMDRLTS